MLKLMIMLFEACYGDCIQVQLLVIAYYQVKNKQKQQDMNCLIESVNSIQPVMLYGIVFCTVTEEIDNTFKKAFQECFSNFCPITQLILYRAQVLVHLIQFYKSKMNNH